MPESHNPPTQPSVTQTALSGDEVELARIQENIERTSTKAQEVIDAGDSTDPLKHRCYQMAIEQIERCRSVDPVQVLAERRRREAEEVRERAECEKHSRSAQWTLIVQKRGHRYANCSLATYEITTEKQREAVEQIRRYLTDLPANVEKGSGLVLIGPAGSGKDHLAAAVMRAAVIHYGIPVQWTSGPDLWECVRDGIKAESSEWESIKPYATAKLLVISDPALRGQPLTSFQADVLYRILDSRYNFLLPTIVTANVKDRADLESLLGGAAVDRITDGAFIIVCDWPSYRKPENPR